MGQALKVIRKILFKCILNMKILIYFQLRIESIWWTILKMLISMLKETLHFWKLFYLGYVWTPWSRENINNNNKFKFVQHKNWLKWALLNFKTLSAQRKTCVFAKSLFHNLTFRIQGATIVVDN